MRCASPTHGLERPSRARLAHRRLGVALERLAVGGAGASARSAGASASTTTLPAPLPDGYAAGVYHKDGPTFLELMTQALSSTEKGYDLLAKKFDYTPFRTPDPILEAMTRAIGGERSIDAALDVCCGTGAAMKHLRPLCRERVVGIDMSQGMLDEAKRRLEDAPGEAKIELVRGDALALPYDGEFDVVTSVGAFGHILPEDEDRFVGGIAKALREGGRFVFATSTRPKPSSPWFWQAHVFNNVMRVRNALLKPEFIMYYLTFLWPEVSPLLERHGFEVEVQKGRCPAPYERAVIVVAKKR
jgi:ubiquinone/menaquinone biosynthesis C-methylase UbiE